MSRTVKQKPAPGTDWWGRRPFSQWISKGQSDTKWWKRKTHKIERQRGKKVGDG